MIPTIRFQILKYSRGNYVRLFWLFALWGVGVVFEASGGIVDSVVGRRPNTGVRLGRLIYQKSHVIWVP